MNPSTSLPSPNLSQPEQKATYRDRVHGCIIGAAIGDAIGGPFEFGPVAAALERTGDAWLSGLHDYAYTMGPHHAYGDLPEKGVGTDDTRYNHILLQLAIELGRLPTREEFALRHLKLYHHPERYFPKDVAKTKEQFDLFEPIASAVLNQPSVMLPNRTVRQRFERADGMGFPMLLGLISLTSVGLFFPGKPEEAYTAAYDIDYYDTGYAREAVGMFAAMVSLGVAGAAPLDVIQPVLEMNPLQLGNCFEGPFVREKLRRLLERLPEGMSDPQTAAWLSRELKHYHPFDPFKTLAIAVVSMRTQPENPLRAMAIAINHAGDDGHFQDIDCYGSVTGALVGALMGIEAFPSDMAATVVNANRNQYGFDLSAHAEDVCRIVIGADNA